jgi:catechol 2,3-dioxygenase
MNSPSYFPVTKALGYVAFQVPDLDAAVSEAQMVHGLRVTHSDRGVAYLSSNDRYFELILKASPRAGFDRIGLEATNEASFDLLRERLSAAEVKYSEVQQPHPGIAKALRFTAPFGHLFELHTPADKLSESFYPTVGTRPRCLSHALLKVEDISRVEDFLTEVLSFRVSDRALNGEIVWLRCSPVHHTINLTLGPNGLHHYAWEVEDWSDFKRLADTLRGHQRQLVWGPGRHGPGKNLFTYHADTTGTLVEYFTDILRVENEETYQWKDWSDISEWNNVWGPLPPANFREYGVPLGEFERP